MASTLPLPLPLLLLVFSLLPIIIISATTAKPPSFRPHALLLRVTKDPSTFQYLTHIRQRTPLVPVKLTLDLGGPSLWVDCDRGYVSSSYRPIRCGSALCKLSQSGACGDCFAGPKPGCNNNTCGLFPENTVPGFWLATPGELATDVISIESTDGSNPGPLVTVPRFPFTCGSTTLLKGLASRVKGMAGFGRTGITLPLRLATTFHFPKKFAICLAGSSDGVIFFGNSPYNFLMRTDASTNLIYTPLIRNPYNLGNTHFKGVSSPEYFIGVKSITVNNKIVPLNTTLLSIKKGRGGTKISTVVPYTVIETSIYKALTGAFIKELPAIPRVAAVKPFTVCYNSTTIFSTRVGPAVPNINFVLQSKDVIWRIFGANSMVGVKEGVLCLGFVDGGVNPETSIVIGGYQLENNLLEFDLAKSRLGFSSSLLFRQTTCANFNFTVNA